MKTRPSAGITTTMTTNNTKSSLRGRSAEPIMTFSEENLLDYLDEILGIDSDEDGPYGIGDAFPNGVDRLHAGVTADSFEPTDRFLPAV